MQRSTKAIILIALLMLPTTTHHDVGLCVDVPMQHRSYLSRYPHHKMAHP